MKSVIQNEKSKQFNALALALVDMPNASLKEIAEACGISKTTLYRFCRTRALLVESLENYSINVLKEIMSSAKLMPQEPDKLLRYLSEELLNQQNIILFLNRFWSDNSDIQKAELEWLKFMDEIFLNGQKLGVFRIDTPAPVMSDIWINLVVGLIESERKGRIARTGFIQQIETAFLHGMSIQN
ncbi:TetR/AcrR family transcriptional regulator [Providencia rettgeri]